MKPPGTGPSPQQDEGPGPAQPPSAERPAEATAASDVAGLRIVGFGASAGGLEAFEQVFSSLPDDTGLAFVLVQHLDPSRSSLLADILQRCTRMPVVEAADGMPVLANRVHVIPPNRDMVIEQGVLRLSEPAEARAQRMPIDTFLRALADDAAENAIGIVLSGMGSDGTLGLRAISAAGGLCLVQDPATARFSAMPSSAAPFAHRVLPLAEMPDALRQAGETAQARPAVQGAAVARILTVLRIATGHDFTQYKRSTVERRIERRMLHHRLKDLGAYLDLLKRDPDEGPALFREILINVTSFFRDPLAYARLRTDVLPSLLAGKRDPQTLRIWVAGCATGEEAYSLAILVREWMEEQQRDLKVQIYATDLDDEAVSAARAGLYAPSVAQDLSPERLRSFFVKEPAGYRVKKDIREMVVFAVQNAVKDPPFTRMDLVSCRNLLIYLQPMLQDRLIRLFHYALRPGGVLFLSPSEGVGDHPALFSIIDRKWKFFRAVPATASERPVLAAGGLSWPRGGAAQRPPDGLARSGQVRVPELARRALLQAFAPAAVVTDVNGNLLYVHGDTGRFLRPAPGQPTHQLVDLAREGLEADLREALRLAAEEGVPTLNRALQVKTDAGSFGAALSVRPLHDPDNGAALLLVTLQEVSDPGMPAPARRPRAGSAAEARLIEQLQQEVLQARQTMKVMLEEQQAANEDLRSTNEELQSTNEELQSTNEELETSREELQSVNEELVTVNAELQHRIDLMAHMQDDLKNLLDNIRLGTIFLDRELRIRRYTQEATRLYRLVPHDIGRPLADIRCDLSSGDLVDEARAVLGSLQAVEREVCTPGGVWFLARIQPYRTVDNEIDGVVLTFADVTERVQAIALRQARDLAEAVVDSVHQPLLVLDDQLQVISANRAYYRTFAASPADTAGRSVFVASQGRWNVPELKDLLESVMPREHRFEGRALATVVDGRTLHLVLSGHRIDVRAPAGQLVLLAIEVLED